MQKDYLYSVPSFFRQILNPSLRPAGPCLLAIPYCLFTSITQSNKGLPLAFISEGEQQEEERQGVAAAGQSGKKGGGGKGQRQVGPHVKGAGAGSYYLLGSRCPQASPGSAGSSATE